MDNDWIDHFQKMAEGNITDNDKIFINQRGRGLGTNRRN
jgi:hypothetical protein